MKNKTAVFFIVFFCTTFIYSQTISLKSIPNYKKWGWNAIVMQNDFITIATVPAIGGRVMQYDLGNLPSVYIDSSLFGKTYTPAQNELHIFGGYKTWPSPQNNWSAAGWPPPPTLDYGLYTVTDTVRSNDSVCVVVESPVEKWLAPGIKFIRKATMYAGTSRVRMEGTIINQGTQPANWGMWGITQSIVNHPGKTDYQNYWAYFPLNPNSTYGKSGVSPSGASKAWKGEILPGIYGVQFSPDNQKVFADPVRGWIAYAVLSDTVVFVKTFNISEGAQYPDNGARVTVYVSDKSALYMEVETKGPVANLPANGGMYTFTENWWSAKVRAPLLVVNSAGAIAKKLSYNSTTKNISGIYGIFYDGTAKVVVKNAAGQILAEGHQYNVSPLKEIKLDETMNFPVNSKTVEVLVQNKNGSLIGVLDAAEVSQLLTSVETTNSLIPSEFRLEQNYPNPFNPSTVIRYSIPASPDPSEGEMLVSLKIYDVLGRQVAALINEQKSPGFYEVKFDGTGLSSGVYFYRLQSGSFSEAKKFMLMK